MSLISVTFPSSTVPFNFHVLFSCRKLTLYEPFGTYPPPQLKTRLSNVSVLLPSFLIPPFKTKLAIGISLFAKSKYNFEFCIIESNE